MWIELVRGLYKASEFASGASEADLKAVEAELGLVLPPDLKALLAEADGITVDHGLGLVWASRRIRADNRRMRSLDQRLYTRVDEGSPAASHLRATESEDCRGRPSVDADAYAIESATASETRSGERPARTTASRTRSIKSAS